MLSQKWIFPETPDPQSCAELARRLKIPALIARLLFRIGLHDPGHAGHFLNPRLKSLGDPFLLPDMRIAVDRMLEAVDRGERIVLYGDYDVDGVTSLTLLDEVLRAYGAAPACFLPVRLEEGYGMSPDAVERCMREHRPQLLIAVDCGTVSISEIAALRERGVDVLVLDHHEIKERRPDCLALVNPKTGGSGFRDFCSVGIVFKVCHALLKTRPLSSFDLRDHLDLVAMGTVADLVPLTGENRILVRAGIRRLESTPRPGLRALMDVAGVKPPIRPSDIGFRLGPRLNASGRLGTAVESLELLQTCDPVRAHELALSLESQNQERRNVERLTLQEAEKQLAVEIDLARESAIVLGARGWHPGVIGIVASRMMRTHHRPAVVVAFFEDGMGKGSGRSIGGLSLIGALGECAECLEQFGGHDMAAGLTLHEDRFGEFRRLFLDTARRHLHRDQLHPAIYLDAEVPLDEVGMGLLEAHDLLQPFGMGNPQPMLWAHGVTPTKDPRVLAEKHLLFELLQSGSRVPAIFFGAAHTPLPPSPWDIAYQIERNEFRGTVSAQVQIHALRGAN